MSATRKPYNRKETARYRRHFDAVAASAIMRGSIHELTSAAGMQYEFNFSWLTPKDVLNRVHDGRSRSSKVVGFGIPVENACATSCQ